jgi:hypothetical protein
MRYCAILCVGNISPILTKNKHIPESRFGTSIYFDYTTNEIMTIMIMVIAIKRIDKLSFSRCQQVNNVIFQMQNRANPPMLLHKIRSISVAMNGKKVLHSNAFCNIYC